MGMRVSRALRVWVVVFAGGSSFVVGLAGCAGPGERLPQCKGKPVPINSFIPAVATATDGRTTAAERLEVAGEESVSHAH